MNCKICGKKIDTGSLCKACKLEKKTKIVNYIKNIGNKIFPVLLSAVVIFLSRRGGGKETR